MSELATATAGLLGHHALKYSTSLVTHSSNQSQSRRSVNGLSMVLAGGTSVCLVSELVATAVAAAKDVAMGILCFNAC